MAASALAPAMAGVLALALGLAACGPESRESARLDPAGFGNDMGTLVSTGDVLVVAHDRLRERERLLQVEVRAQRQALFGAPGRPEVGSAPDRDHRWRRDPASSQLLSRLLVPEERVPVLDRRAGGVDVAALDLELRLLQVALLTDPGPDLLG